MICPYCQSDECKRSKRRRLRDYLIGLSGARPWRCRACASRFMAFAVPLRYQRYAHCEKCGNLDLQRISRSYVTEGNFVWLGRLLHFPAYRCDPCRYRFFSLRAYHRIAPVRYQVLSS